MTYGFRSHCITRPFAPRKLGVQAGALIGRKHTLKSVKRSGCKPGRMDPSRLADAVLDTAFPDGPDAAAIALSWR